uniref:Putative LAGLIDADG homing endonuclease n=1 Tax=Rhexinema sarcinoideum TaxID=43261 RepID=A0A1B2RYR2_9CHLO|nr:putative LAGLIDADG homing endonuclease [Rhexinema sarcinoideum]
MTKLEVQWIVGFVDGEGCFFVGINEQPSMTTGFQVLPEFVVTQHQRDESILYALKEYWGFGVVRKNHGDRLCYRVRGLENLLKSIVPFFEKHSLKTKKKIDFLKFRKILKLIENHEHLTVEGLLKIESLRVEMNTGLTKPRKRLRLIENKLVFEKESIIESSLS